MLSPWTMGPRGTTMQKNAHFGVAVMAACSMELALAAAHAQGTDTDDKGPKVESAESELETVTVTGSLLPTAPDAVAVPVIALDAKQLEQNGVSTNALEILRKAIPSFA